MSENSFLSESVVVWSENYSETVNLVMNYLSIEEGKSVLTEKSLSAKKFEYH